MQLIVQLLLVGQMLDYLSVVQLSYAVIQFLLTTGLKNFFSHAIM